jgi:hypothetical protein
MHHVHWFTIVCLVAWLIYARLKDPTDWIPLGFGIGLFAVVPIAEFVRDMVFALN